MDYAMLSQVCFYGGLLSIPASIALWFYGAALVPNALDDIIDPAMRAAMMSAYCWALSITNASCVGPVREPGVG